jgi:hypothetical protein
MAIKNYTTEVGATRTLAEIQEMLIEAGASGILLESKDRAVVSVSFEIVANGDVYRYRLPCRHFGIFMLLKDDVSAQRVMRGKGIKFGVEHCRNVGWRIVRDWLDAQLALVEADMADLREVMFPYMLSKEGKTVYEVFGGNRLLGMKE